MTTINAGTPIRCNRCSEVFEAPKEMERDQFWGQSAARINDDFCNCPHCNQTDVHWVYASDIIPEGLNADKQKTWKRTH